jgi:hypothetical protein
MHRRTLVGLAIDAAACAVIATSGGCTGTLLEPSPFDHDGGIDSGRVVSPVTIPDADGDSSVTGVGNEGGNGGGVIPTPPTAVGKIDILFDIDNSASMGDKQAYLANAIPDLITRLVTPNCLDGAGNVTGVSNENGDCVDPGSTPEFAPVRDMHIGIVSSSLGPRLGDACPTTGLYATQAVAGGGSVDRHNDDQGHLLNRASNPSNLSNYAQSPLADAGPANFLDWFPGATASADAGAVTSAVQLNQDFQSLVVGVQAFGCGIESQLESWYRFLVQPDPYASLTTDSKQRAQWAGVDTTILAQRAAFLRPDSLVAVIVLSDENDSEVDVRAFGGSAWNFMSQGFAPPRGTATCATNPGDPNCTSCFNNTTGDPSCALGKYTSDTDWGFDLNLRHVHEKQKYGVDVQFPMQRYVVGLTSPKVPNRDGEYPPDGTGGYAASYQGLLAANMGCTNPLFAAKLPAPPPGVSVAQWQPTAAELCNLPLGQRNAPYVFYSHIGGVPHQLLQVDPTSANSPQKESLSAADWRRILGNDPANYDYSGIDPHMVESYQSRVNSPVPVGGFPVAPTSSAEGTDPISGREFVTDSTSPLHQGLRVDREYACTFRLAAPRLCDGNATSADPTLLDSCDCQPPAPGDVSTFTHDEVPAVCNDTTPTQQDFAKAYPTIRELLLAQMLGNVPGANEGVVSSICPIHVVEASPGDPLYGYRPAMSALVDRLKRSL